jgi:hypothetical protein
METEADALWTIEELGGQVAEALADGYRGVPSGRVRDVPDLRTIRYYTTLGLLDRAAAMRGRTALYGRRHLFQLVAIKRLQARGHSLAEIQQRLVGLSDTALRWVAEVPERREESFWRGDPAAVADDAGGAGPPGEPQGTEDRVGLGDGVSLALTPRRPMDDEDLRVIRMAAAPLIEILRLRGLIGPGERGGSR